MSVVLWIKNYIKSKGYTVEHSELYQYNKSTILMENNLISSISNRIKHIKARYFFIKYQINHRNV